MLQIQCTSKFTFPGLKKRREQPFSSNLNGLKSWLALTRASNAPQILSFGSWFRSSSSFSRTRGPYTCSSALTAQEHLKSCLTYAFGSTLLRLASRPFTVWETSCQQPFFGGRTYQSRKTCSKYARSVPQISKYFLRSYEKCMLEVCFKY